MTKISVISKIRRLIKQNKERELEAIHAYDFIVDAMIERVMQILKAEQVFKSDSDLIREGTRMPLLKISVANTIYATVDKYLQALKYVLLGKLAEPSVQAIVEELKLKSKLPKGGLMQAYLDTIDTYRQQFKDTTHKPAPRTPARWRGEAIKTIMSRSGRYVDQTITEMRNKVITAIQDTLSAQAMDAHAAVKESLLERLQDSALSVTERRKLIRDQMAKTIKTGASLQQTKQALKDATEAHEVNWDRIVRTEYSMASNVASVSTIADTAGQYELDPVVAILDKQDDRESEFCLEHSHHADGAWKYYKLSSLKPAGYNLSRKKADWHNSVPPRHFNCYDKHTEVLTSRGFLKFADVDISKDMFLSVDLETGNAHWVYAKQQIVHTVSHIVRYTGHRFDLAVSDGHRHVVRTHKWKGKKKNGRTPWRIEHEDFNSVPFASKHSAQFLCTIPNWLGTLPENWNILKVTKCDLKSFAEFMGYWLSEGNITLNKKRYEIKITQHKPHKEKMFACAEKVFGSISKVRIGENACFVPLHPDNTDHSIIIEYFCALGHSYDKFVPMEIKNLPKDLLEVFLSAFILGDGSMIPERHVEGFGTFTESRSLSTSSPRLEADMCEIILKCGYTAGMHHSEPVTTEFRNGIYTPNHVQRRISVNKEVYQNLHSLNREVVEYNDLVYDVELEQYGTLIVKRDKGVCVSGNCRCMLIYVPQGFKLDTGGSLVALAKGENLIIN